MRGPENQQGNLLVNDFGTTVQRVKELIPVSHQNNNIILPAKLNTNNAGMKVSTTKVSANECIIFKVSQVSNYDKKY